MSHLSSQGWQPIDAAPSDQEILVFTPEWGPIIASFNSEFGEWLSRMQVPVSMTQPEDHPSHWRPLPAAPESDGDASGSSTQTLSAVGA